MNVPEGPVRALVLGDLMLDVRLNGIVERISPEAPVPVFRETGLPEYGPGGAANAAACLAALGADVTVGGAVGSDEDGYVLLNRLPPASTRIATANGSRTIAKTRVMGGGQQLMRLDREGNRTTLGEAAENYILPRIEEFVRGSDVVVLSDYDKGTLTVRFVRAVVAACRKHEIPLVVDPKRADFEVYSGATVLTPNYAEYRRASGVCDGSLSRYCDWLLLTKGEQGMTLHKTWGDPLHFPALAPRVVDACGAGDAVVGALAYWLGAKRPMEEACEAASLAAAIAVGKPGCYQPSAAEMRVGLGKVASAEDALSICKSARARRRARVVFTNGCFDVLHPGHLATLRHARAAGDLLVVGLNSDASVSRLKGMWRPRLAFEHRAAMLAALPEVDLVVGFDGDHPGHLVELLRPDVLAKGGDYRPDEVAGAEHAGQVVICPLVEGLSSSRVIAST